MSDEPKKIKIVFAPGSMDSLTEDMSPEEVNELMAMIEAQLRDATGEDLNFSAMPVSLDELKETDPELHAELTKQLESLDLSALESSIHEMHLPMDAPVKRVLH